MKKVAIVACVVGVIAAIAPNGAAAAPGTLCVGAEPGCYSTLQAAVDAAHDGDTIRIAPGTYAGGVVVDVSVAIVGAGLHSTIIKGGGPVLTIGVPASTSQPTVSITGVTITGGVTTSAPTPDGPISYVAIGGGVLIHGPATPDDVGAIVTIRNSLVTGNRATPTETIDTDEPCCPFAQAIGGGIADNGQLTLINTTVSNNLVGGPVAMIASGGGIWTATGGGPGTLTLINSTVTGNTASAVAPNGRFAEGGGLFVQDGEKLTVTNSVVSNNTASLSSAYPVGIEMNANTGGIRIGGFGGSATIKGTRITGNVVSVDAPQGEATAVIAALGVGFTDCVCGQTLVLKDSVISGNRTTATVAASPAGDGSGGAVQIDVPATVTRTAIIGNSASLTNLAGPGFAFGALVTVDSESEPVVLKNSVVSGNTVRASSPSGPATVVGAGITNAASLELHGVLVTNNTGTATGPSGGAFGGGIWNGALPFPDAPTPHLLLENTLVAGNKLTASPGLDVQGGGIFTPGFPITTINSLIVRNSPDQCFGC